MGGAPREGVDEDVFDGGAAVREGELCVSPTARPNDLNQAPDAEGNRRPNRLLRSTFNPVSELAGVIVRSTREEAHLRGWRLRQAGSIWRGVAVWRHLASASPTFCDVCCIA